MQKPVSPLPPLQAEQVRRLAGPLSAAAVARIIVSGATAGELLKACHWLASGEARSAHPEPPPGTVQWLCAVLEAEMHAAEDRGAGRRNERWPATRRGRRQCVDETISHSTTLWDQ